jgi:hypothetical protein
VNRRDFLTKGAISAAVVAVPTVPTKVITTDTFPMTKEEMQSLVKECQGNSNFVIRPECGLIPEGMSLTTTPVSSYWRYHKGNRVATLHVRFSDKHICFYVEEMDAPMPTTYTRPSLQQWARNRRYDE